MILKVTMSIFDLFKPKNVFRRSTVSPTADEAIKRDWVKIDELVKVGRPSSLREALITADRSLDTALKEIFDGETMGERLKNASNRFEKTTYQKIWDAHKVRNSLVHQSGYEPPYFVIQKALEDLKEALTFLGVRL